MATAVEAKPENECLGRMPREKVRGFPTDSACCSANCTLGLLRIF